MLLRIFVEPQEGATYDDQLVYAQLAEELGFDGFFRSDHYISFTFGDGLPGPTDAWTTLAGLARDTSRLRLGTLVSPVTFRQPGPLAITVAQVDAMSGGRVELGFGAGWNDREHAAYGLDFPATGERFGRLEEQLEILTGLWTAPAGDRYSYEGRYYTLVDSPALPKPVQQPHPPIVMGGWGQRRTPRLAAHFATEFNVGFAPVPDFAPSVRRVRDACVAIGRDPASLRTSIAISVYCGRDDAEVAKRASVVGLDPDTARQRAIAGTPSEVAERLGAYRDAGADVAYLQLVDLHDPEHVRLLGTEVLPAFL
jgi:F420-dependent oxidoreductase-like protein